MVEIIENWQQMAVNRRPKKVTDPKIPHVSEFLTDGQWSRRPCVVLGGGPSLKPFIGRLGEFPESTHFAGVNQSWRLCAEVIYAIDTQVFDLAEAEYKDEWDQKTAEGQVRITHRVNAAKGCWAGCSWVDQLASEAWGQSFGKGMVAPNNSGLAALNVADILGADPIILLGFDGWHAGQPQNWHEDYPEKTGFRPANPQKTCGRWEINFRAIARKIRGTVYNACPESTYRSFPRITFEKAVKICHGNPGFVIGGGPSLRGFDFARLEGRRCMAINVAFKDVSWAEVAYVGDARLLDSLADDKDWIRFAGTRYTRANKLAETKKLQPASLKALPATKTWAKDLSGIVSLGNSGLSGINLAEQLGWNPIFLLGFDCQGIEDDGRMANYHTRYPRGWAKPGSYLKTKFINAFDRVHDDITAKVYNCTSGSALECFPQLSLEGALALCNRSE